MFCSQCGKEIDENATFCGYCGSAQRTVRVSVTKKTKPIMKWVILAVTSVLLIIIGIAIGISKQSKEVKPGEEELIFTDETTAEQMESTEQPEELWKEAYCDFLIVINSENVNLIHEQYAYMEDEINQFYNKNYNAFGLDVSEKFASPEELLFSLIYMDEDEIPELVLTGDYGGMILTFIEDMIRPITWKTDDYESNTMDFWGGEYYFSGRDGKIMENINFLEDFRDVRIYQYNASAQCIEMQEYLSHGYDEPSEEIDMLIAKYIDEINNKIYGTYSISNDNLADVLMYEEARTKDLNSALVSSTDEIVDMGSMFMENMSNKDTIREQISSLTDIRYEEEQEMAAIVGYRDDVEVYREEGDNYIAYKNIRIQNLELLGIYPGMPVWKAVRLLESAGFYYSRWMDCMTYVTGEEFGDWGVGLYIDNDNRVTGIELYCIG